ncbi:MAG: hypothetical protein ACKVU4_14530 [Phycisphaerales bacterium]
MHDTPAVTARPRTPGLGRRAALILAAFASVTAEAQIVTIQRAQPAAAAPAAPVTVQPATTQPDQPAPAPANAPNPDFTPQEIERLRAAYDELPEPERAQMVAAYQDMGVDLLVLFGLKQPDPALPPQTIEMAVQALDFARKPDAVLAARSQLGFGAAESRDMPDSKDTVALAKWLHTNVLAGEWDALGRVLGTLKPAEATAVYSHVLRSTNQAAQGLLPEEVLILGDACPGDLVDWQLDVLAQLLTTASGRYGTGPFMARLKAGTPKFGSGTDAARDRTVRLLVGAGLPMEAYGFLPALEDARASADARVMYGHARYHEDLGTSGRAGAESEDHLHRGWALLGEVAMLNGADVALRKDAMKRAIELLPSIPPAQATEWLGRVFANDALGPAALEVVALQAMTVRDRKVDAAKRAQGLATMKAAVDTLIAQPSLNMDALRVPLRMLTTALADEVEAVVKEKGQVRGVAPEAELLFRASPDERWLAAIEPSVAIRGHRACIAVATITDETDVALDALALAVRCFPDQGAVFADEFLQLWEGRLNPKARPGEEWMDSPYIIYYGAQRLPSAPLTRGRQQRNLALLARLLTILDGIGVPARELPNVTAAFKACHARTEVYNRAEIVGVFGTVDHVPAQTAASLAEAMRLGLGGDWRNRQSQRTYGMMRSAAEIAVLVEEGYELAIELASRAVALEPDSWRHIVLKAALSYDRVQFKQTQKKDDFTTYNEYRRQAFAAFEQASTQYATLVARGDEHDTAGVYLQWFSAVLDAGQPTPGSDAAEAEEQTNEDQLGRIAAALRSMPGDAPQRHIGAFARDLVDSLGAAPPERKPTIVRAAVRIVGDHPAGAPIRRLNELYEDLVSNEIRLRLTIDGPDAVGSGRLFGLSLTLRYTNSVDRETGGFDKYLYQDAYVRIGNQYRSVNYQGQIRRGIEAALNNGFTIESMGFFEPLTPSREVREDGQTGWQEKPLAYVIVKAKDPSVDRIPQVTFDMHFEDQLGAVTLPILSNSPLLDAAGTPAARPVKSLKVSQTVDARRLITGSKDRAVTLEVHASGEGVIPEAEELLAGLRDALPGYQLANDGIEARPFTVLQTDDGRGRFFRPDMTDENKTYAKADESGIFRLGTERSWLVTFTPATGAAAGRAFTLPKLAGGFEGVLASRQYTDMDIVPVTSATVALNPRWSLKAKIAGVLAALLATSALAWWIVRARRPRAQVADDLVLPARITPLSVVASLERLAAGMSDGPLQSIRADIAAIQIAHFGPDGHSPGPDEAAMRDTLERWSRAARA